jgi:hypothetical protein
MKKKILNSIVLDPKKIKEVKTHYNRYGYVVLKPLLTSKDINKISYLVEKKMNKIMIGGPSIFESNDLILRVPEITSLIFKKEYLKVLKTILGCKYFDLQHSKFNAKNTKGGSKILPHQDFPYFPHTDDRLLAFAFHLDGSYPENGGMFFYGGKWNKPIMHQSLNGNKKKFLISNTKLKKFQIHNLVCPPGSISIHSSFAVHGSNESNGFKRRLCVYQLRHPENKQIGGAIWKCSNLNPVTMRYNDYNYEYMGKKYFGRRLWEPKEYFND